MKGLTKTILIAVLAVVFLSIFPQKIPSDKNPGTYYCVVYFVMENKDRYLHHTPDVECGPPDDWHPGPWGNWGVDSNLGSRWDGDQFQGWKYAEGHNEWNSCYQDYPPPKPCSTYYNADERSPGMCWKQKRTCENIYAYGSEEWEIDVPDWDDG